MESLGLRLRSNGGDPSPALRIHRDGLSEARFRSTVRIPRRPRGVAVRARSVSANVESDRGREGRSSSVLDSCTNAVVRSNKKGGRVKGTVSSDVLHHWIFDSITEIVRNLGKAPYLAHIYPNHDRSSILDYNPVTLRIEMGIPERWPWIKRSWEEGAPVPDGIILVEPLESFVIDRDFEESCQTKTRLWGILVQGRGADSHACYLLKTSTAYSSGACCTYFLLAQTQSFDNSTAELQLAKDWAF